MPDTPRRFAPHHGAFGNDRFGILAERFARFFGTPRFIIVQTILVVAWISLNAAAIGFDWDPYPFILLNLAFSTQAAYAAPLILLAQTRQADRDKLREGAVETHREAEAAAAESFQMRLDEMLEHQRAVTGEHARMLAANTRLTQRIARLTEDLHGRAYADPPAGS